MHSIMRRRTVAGLLAGTAMVLGGASGVSAASAASGAAADAIVPTPTRVVCATRTTPCTVSFLPHSPLVQGTVDKAGTGVQQVPWTLSRNGVVLCRGTYRPSDPVRAWSCRITLIPAVLTFSTPGTPGPTAITVQ